MPYVPGFDYDLFISYSSQDNDGGVIEEVVALLEKSLSDNLVNCFSPREKVRIFFDRERLRTQTGVQWENELKMASSSSALMVVLLSPNYLSSDYCTKEREWFDTQPHTAAEHSYAVVGWRSVAANLMPLEFERTQRHPDGDSWLGDWPPSQRMESIRQFALKLRDRIVAMRSALSAVFLGPAHGRSAVTRQRLRDELERTGYRVEPGPAYVYQDANRAREHLGGALVALHFVGDGLCIEGLELIEESLRCAARTTVIQPIGSQLSPDERDLLSEVDERGARYAKLINKTDEQVWEWVQWEVKAARFQRNKSEFAVGVACEARDLRGAKAVADLIGGLGMPARYPAFDRAASTTEKLKALRATITQSQALLCYWGAADGRALEQRLEQDARRRYRARAWYIAPPCDMPAKEKLRHTREMVLWQGNEGADLATLEPFLRDLGWEPEA